MPPNPLLSSITAATRANRDLARVTARLGTKRNPRGAVLSAYRVALAAIYAALTAQTASGRLDTVAVQDALTTLDVAVRASATTALREGWAIGERLAAAQLEAYGEPVPDVMMDGAYMALAEQAAVAEVSRQRSGVLALIAGGAARALIVGDDTRRGVLRPAPVVREVSNWATRAANRAVAVTTNPPPVPMMPVEEPRPRFQKQVIAALDERTTDCCLRAHGQIVDLDGMFHLTGTPRYADRMPEPPFHDFCRSVWVLYRAEWDDGITARMQDGAATIQAERAAGGTGERHPADAFAG